DLDPGTYDTCDPFTGQCLFTSDPTGGPATCEPTPFGVPAPGCNDDNPCTIDVCVGTEGLMCFYVAVICDDFDPCTSDTCDPTGVGCEFTPIAGCLGCSDDADCDDGNACTVDQCDESQCESELPPFGTPPLHPECAEEP
ncbi:MAG: hypothetical protein VX223_16010, partial [Myxococcota bacterium]|nr:hypothetical protein [Myxococcota bacterium]